MTIIISISDALQTPSQLGFSCIFPAFKWILLLPAISQQILPMKSEIDSFLGSLSQFRSACPSIIVYLQFDPSGKKTNIAVNA
jgi:hypothetical protein